MPTATTGPVAVPVGEPPSGSTLTASVTPSPNFARNSGGTRTLALASLRQDAERFGGIVTFDQPDFQRLGLRLPGRNRRRPSGRPLPASYWASRIDRGAALAGEFGNQRPFLADGLEDADAKVAT